MPNNFHFDGASLFYSSQCPHPSNPKTPSDPNFWKSKTQLTFLGIVGVDWTSGCWRVVIEDLFVGSTAPYTSTSWFLVHVVLGRTSSSSVAGRGIAIKNGVKRDRAEEKRGRGFEQHLSCGDRLSSFFLFPSFFLRTEKWQRENGDVRLGWRVFWNRWRLRYILMVEGEIE